MPLAFPGSGYLCPGLRATLCLLTVDLEHPIGQLGNLLQVWVQRRRVEQDGHHLIGIILNYKCKYSEETNKLEFNKVLIGQYIVKAF